MTARRRNGTGTNQEAVRRHNLATLLGHVHHSDGLSRAALTTRMGLNRSTIADLVHELEDLDAVREELPGATGGAGRPSFDVRPSAQSVFVIAAELGVDTIEVARVGLGGELLERRTAMAPDDPSPEAVVTRAVEMVQALMAGCEPQARLVGVGVAVPGVVSDRDGLVRFGPNLGWSDVPLADLLRERLGRRVPLHLGNDAELGALAEHTRGVGRRLGHLIYLSGDVGVGGGVIVAGAPMIGASGYAGEVGHQPFNPVGETCRCGNTGCWETEIGSHAIAAAVGCPVDEIDRLEGYLAPGTEPTDELRAVGRALGLGLGGLVNIFNPEMIILGGALRWVLPLVGEEVLAAMRDRALMAPADQTQIVVPMLGGDSVVLGAAELAFSDLLADPVGVLAGTSPIDRAAMTP